MLQPPPYKGGEWGAVTAGKVRNRVGLSDTVIFREKTADSGLTTLLARS